MRWPENQQGSRVTCRDDVLAAMHALVQRHGRDVFKLEDIVLEVESRELQRRSQLFARTSFQRCASMRQPTTQFAIQT